MRLVHVAPFAPDQIEHLLRVRCAVDRSVLRVLHLEAAPAFFGRFMNQYTGFGNTTRPVAAEVHVRFLRRNQQKVRVRLRLQRPEVRVELVEPHVGEIGGMAVAMEVHDHRRVDAHRFQDRLERRRPLRSRWPSPGPCRRGASACSASCIRRAQESDRGSCSAARARARPRARRPRAERRRPCAARGRAAHSPTGSTASSRRGAAGCRAPTRPRQERCHRYPRFDEKSRGKKYWCGAGNTATLPPAVFAASVR